MIIRHLKVPTYLIYVSDNKKLINVVDIWDSFLWLFEKIRI